MNFSKIHTLVEEKIILGIPCITNEDIFNLCITAAKYNTYTAKRNQDLAFLECFEYTGE